MGWATGEFGVETGSGGEQEGREGKDLLLSGQYQFSVDFGFLFR